MNKLLDSTSLLVLSLDTCLIVCNTQKNRRLEVNYIVAGLWSIFGSRLLSEGNPVLCQLILPIRNSARFSVMSTSIHRYMCLSTALTDGPLKITGRGAKNYLCRNFFPLSKLSAGFFFSGVSGWLVVILACGVSWGAPQAPHFLLLHLFIRKKAAFS